VKPGGFKRWYVAAAKSVAADVPQRFFRGFHSAPLLDVLALATWGDTKGQLLDAIDGENWDTAVFDCVEVALDVGMNLTTTVVPWL
jgi:hypothetical protein